MSEAFLHIGDIVTVGEGAVGGDPCLLVSQGWSETRVTIDGLGPHASGVPREALFLLWGQQNYSVEKQLCAALERVGKTRDEARVCASSDPLIGSLYIEREKEKKNNMQEFEMAKGREVRYGNVVQLQHHTSEKYLSVSRQTAEHIRDGRRVEVNRNAGESAWFRIMPRLKVHSEGERVHVGDPIVFEHVVTGFNLTVSHAARRDSTTAADPAATKAAPLKKFANAATALRRMHASALAPLPEGGAGDAEDNQSRGSASESRPGRQVTFTEPATPTTPAPTSPAAAPVPASFREVYAAKDGGAFKIHVFRLFSDERQVRNVVGGSPVRILHKEADGTITSTQSGTEVLVATDAAERRSSNAAVRRASLGAHARARAHAPSCGTQVHWRRHPRATPLPLARAYRANQPRARRRPQWEFQLADRSGRPLVQGGGGALNWDSTFRLLHVASGKVLGLTVDGDAKAFTEEHGHLFLTPSNDPEVTLFEVEAQYAGLEGALLPFAAALATPGPAPLAPHSPERDVHGSIMPCLQAPSTSTDSSLSATAPRAATCT